MFRWSIQALFAEPARLAGSIVGTALALLLVVFFQAVFEGESEQVVAYLEATEADLWVMQDGVSNMHMASSLLWDEQATRVSEVEGVADATPILYMNTLLRAGGRDWFSYIVGLEPHAPRGGPWAMVVGRAAPGPGEVVLPEVIALLSGLGPGDSIHLVDRELTIVGLSRGTFSMANSVTFVSWQDLEEIMDLAGGLSYLLVAAELGTDSTELVERIESDVDEVHAMTKHEFVEEDRKLALQMGTEIIEIMSLIGAIVAIVIIAFTVFSQIVHHQRSYALGLALGFPASYLVLAAITQATLIAVAGLGLAAVLAFTVLPLLPAAAPQLTVSVRLDHVVRVGSLALLAAVASGALPAARLARVDPTTVFSAR